MTMGTCFGRRGDESVGLSCALRNDRGGAGGGAGIKGGARDEVGLMEGEEPGRCFRALWKLADGRSSRCSSELCTRLDFGDFGLLHREFSFDVGFELAAVECAQAPRGIIVSNLILRLRPQCLGFLEYQRRTKRVRRRRQHTGAGGRGGRRSKSTDIGREEACGAPLGGHKGSLNRPRLHRRSTLSVSNVRTGMTRSQAAAD